MRKHVSWVLSLGSTLALLGSAGCKQTSSSEAESSSCPEGQAACGDECVTLSSDPQHCGVCGQPCPTAAYCRDGECSCQTGLSLCGQSCVDLTQNPAHCGACDIACRATQICVAGSCSCGPGLIACEGACVDPTTNSSHCGRCDVVCAGGQACNGGSCTCPTGQQLCSGSCTDTTSDGSNCGGCSVACDVGQSCVAGVCTNGGGTGGSPGTGGVPASSGAPNTGGAAGTGGIPTTGGAGTTGSCEGTFSIETSLSAAIGTVGIIDWSFAAEMEDAYIDFGRDAAAYEYRAPVPSPSATGNRTLLLGMKPSTTYSFQIVATVNGDTCTSDVQTVTTNPVRNGLPAIDIETPLPDRLYEGFTVACEFMGGGGGGGGGWAFILDKDGDIVWWYEASCGRARMSYDGQYMWMGNTNNGTTNGTLMRVLMDGTGEQSYDFPLRHHDFTLTPDDTIALIEYDSNSPNQACDIIQEMDPATGQATTLLEVRSADSSSSGQCHSNAINWWPDRDLYTVSVLNWDSIIAFTRTGQLQWVFGGNASDYSNASWSRQHQHHLLANSLLLFNNSGSGNGSAVLELQMNEDMSATEILNYSSGYSSTSLGDAKRLPNGNTLITYSNNGVMQEITAEQQLVQQIETDGLGYTVRRRTLYGPPPPYAD